MIIVDVPCDGGDYWRHERVEDDDSGRSGGGSLTLMGRMTSSCGVQIHDLLLLLLGTPCLHRIALTPWDCFHSPLLFDSPHIALLVLQ